MAEDEPWLKEACRELSEAYELAFKPMGDAPSWRMINKVISSLDGLALDGLADVGAAKAS